MLESLRYDPAGKEIQNLLIFKADTLSSEPHGLGHLE